MMRIGNPIPLFLDARGALSDGGFIYIGQANTDPETTPLAVYWDANLTVLAEQPLRTVGGQIVNGASVASVFTDAEDYSIRLRDSDGVQSLYSASVFNDNQSFQPISPELTAISLLTTTAYGRALLTLSGQAALAAATGIPAPLPAAGGTVSSYIYRQGSGPFVHWANPTYTGDTIYVTESGTGDPTVSPGDLWCQLQ